MALPEFSMRQLLEAGVHFGHQAHRWNPRTQKFIFGERSKIHIIDLSQTVPLLHQALVQARDVASNGGRVLFVGTKRQASDIVSQSAKRCAQYYVNHRWLGGTLTNWQTISHSIARLRKLEDMLASDEDTGLTKKEILNLTRERDKLDRALGGIKDMGGTPDLMFVIDTNKEGIAIQEARKLGIPIIAVIDTNCDPSAADFPIPGNDDASRAISLYCELMADAILDGMAQGQVDLGVDLGAAENPVELAITEEVAAAAEAAPAAKAEPKAEPAPAAEAKADDISLLSGVGPKIAEALTSEGITTFKQIAEMSAEDIAALDEKLTLGGRFEREEWAEQAKELMAGKAPRAKVDQEKAASAE